MTPDERRDALESIARQVRVCTRCRLSQSRTRAVPGEGNPDTEVMFVGEGPGFNEDQQGRPFVGAAGSLLTELLTSVGWGRDDVFITNVVKCRPPGNRDPEPDEIAACRPYLRRQLEVLDPALVVTLGRFSMGAFMPGARIGAAHGTLRPIDPETGARDAMAYAMYHPAAAFRQATMRATLFNDMLGVPDALLHARARRSRSDEPEPRPDERMARRADAPPSDDATLRPGLHPGTELEDQDRAARTRDPVAGGDDTLAVPAEVPVAASGEEEFEAGVESSRTSRGGEAVPSEDVPPTAPGGEETVPAGDVDEAPAGRVPMPTRAAPRDAAGEQLGLF